VLKRHRWTAPEILHTCGDILVTCESGWLCENASNRLVKPVWEGIDMCLFLRRIICSKFFQKLMAFSAAAGVMVFGADARILPGPVQPPRGSRRLLGASPSTVDDKARGNWGGENKITTCINLVARHPKDARSGWPNSERRPPQLLLHLAAFEDSFAKYLRVLPSSTAPPQAAVPSRSL
jgi:hypothetical protein